MGASILSVNGKLRSLYDRATVTEERAHGYNEADIGQPLIVRYLYFLLRFDKPEKKNKVMISTFLKATETKEAAAEAINYYDPKARVDEKKELRITDFGGEHYGHPLCYYTKSYLGESLYFTTKIMELDRVDRKVVAAIQRGIGTVASLPAFAEFLPYAAGASVGVSLFEKIVNLFNRDDAIVGGHDLDLHFNAVNVRQLQSGRIVCVHDKEQDELLSGDKYALRQDNRLIEVNSGKEYTETPYFVIQIDSKLNKKLESFDYYLGAADLLKQTNRGGDPTELISTVVEIFKGYNDIEAVQEIEELSVDADREAARKKIMALHKSMSKEARSLYNERVKELTGSG
jgi:hypothetical protein